MNGYQGWWKGHTDILWDNRRSLQLCLVCNYFVVDNVLYRNILIVGLCPFRYSFTNYKCKLELLLSGSQPSKQLGQFTKYHSVVFEDRFLTSLLKSSLPTRGSAMSITRISSTGDHGHRIENSFQSHLAYSSFATGLVMVMDTTLICPISMAFDGYNRLSINWASFRSWPFLQLCFHSLLMASNIQWTQSVEVITGAHNRFCRWH
jgi:hypothetical protein